MKRSSAALAGILVLLAVAQGFYASHLNRLLYQVYGPFFDSMAYTNQMADILTIAKEQGILAGIRTSFHSGTVSLPWVIVSLLSPILPYSRLVGVWMQEFWMAALALSVFTYLHKYRGANPLWAAAVSVPFISFGAVYRFNGGISDFRMDLFLYLFLSLTGIWYLAAREQDSIWPWALSGVFLCFTILNRATAPAYFAVMYGPVFLAHLVQTPAKERGKLILRAGVSWGAGLAVGCLALSSNWNFIYYYYFVWGADPNANLPLSVSRRHFDMALDNLGWLMTRAALFMLFLQVAIRRLELSPRQLLRMTYWEIFYIGCAPALLLMSRGAGLNFLVTIPCIFGWLLFAVAPLRGPIPYSRWSWLGAAVLLLTCSYYNYRGYVVHTQPGEHKVPMMQALQKGIDLMQADALARGKRTAQFTTSHIVDYQTSALRNVLIYERGAVPHEGAYRLRSGLVLRADQEWVMSPSVPLNWDKELPGATDEAKCAYLVQLANREVDYLFLPDEESINWMEHHRRQNLINLKIRMLKGQLLATGRWKAIGDPLTASAYERVILYAKQ